MAEKIRLRVFRFDPDADKKPRYEEYEVPYHKDMRILEALDYIRENIDPTLAHRFSCRRKRCGTCAVNVEGQPYLACFEAARENMKIDPLPGFPLVRDLVVDRTWYESSIDELILSSRRNSKSE